jgi:hypothetical protein
VRCAPDAIWWPTDRSRAEHPIPHRPRAAGSRARVTMRLSDCPSTSRRYHESSGRLGPTAREGIDERDDQWSLRLSALGSPGARSSPLVARGGVRRQSRSSSSNGSALTKSATYRAQLAYRTACKFADCRSSRTLRRREDQRQRATGARQPRGPADDTCKPLLAGGSTVTGDTTAPATSSPAGPGAVATNCLTLPALPCDARRELRMTYGIQPLLDRGIIGTGQTVVLTEFLPSSTESHRRVPATRYRPMNARPLL